MANYCTVSQVAAFAQEFDALSPEGQDLIVTAASRLFDNLVGVEEDFFKQADGETDKVLFGDGTAYLKLPPYTLLGADPIIILDNEDDEYEVPEYFEQNGYLVIKGYGQGVPTLDNAMAVVGSPWPSERVMVTPAATNFVGWPVNYEITVSANWGFPTVPTDVQQATIQLAIHLWRTSDPAFTMISQSGQPYTPPAVPNQAQVIVDQYKAKYTDYALFA